MTLNISIPETTEQQLRARAAATGQDVSDYVRSVLEKDLASVPPAAPEKTLAEILAPIQEGFAQSGMSDDEIDSFFEAIVKEVRAERRAANV